MGTSFQVTIDCADPEALGGFWARALHYREQEPPAGFDDWPSFLAAQGISESEWASAYAIVDPEGKGPRIYLQRVPEPKVTKNRVHLDVNVTAGRSQAVDERRQVVNEEIARLVEEGAAHVRTVDGQPGEYFAVMQDPEGNEFCLH